MTLATWHWHIEISSKCTLKCPRCARQEVPDGLINTELNLEFFKKNFTPEFIISNVEKITFCGDDGDPIYAHDLVPVIEYIKKIKPVEIVIITNGSYKKTEWWNDLGKLLDNRDSVHFSIDGYDNASNNLYRINSDYDSIINGLKTLRSVSKCSIVWATIAFKFNQDKIELLKQSAKSLGVDIFQLTKSTKFGSIYPSYGINDHLEPSTKFVSSTHRFEREIFYLNSNLTPNPISLTNLDLLQKTQIKNNVKPLCMIGNKGLYIDARGTLYPCCWVANRYSHNSEWRTLSKNFNLRERTLDQVLQDKFWTDEFQTFKWQECQTKCSADIVDVGYATQW